MSGKSNIKATWPITLAMAVMILLVVFFTRSIIFNNKKVEPPQMTPVSNIIDELKAYTKYDVTLKFTNSLSYFKGSQTIQYTHEGQTTTNQILLKLYMNLYSEDAVQRPYFADSKPHILKDGYEYGGMEVATVKVNGKVVDYKQEFTNLWIDLPHTMKQGEDAEIFVEFCGSMPYIDHTIGGDGTSLWIKSFLPQMAVFKDGKGWDDTNIYGTGKYVYAEPADYTVKFIVDEGLLPIATGMLLNKEVYDEYTNQYVYEAKKVRDFGVYIGAELPKTELKLSNDKKLVFYSKRIFDVEQVTQSVKDTVDYYQQYFGTYPYDQLILIDTPEYSCMKQYPQMLVGDMQQLLESEEKLDLAIGYQWLPYIIMHHPGTDGWLDTSLIFYISKRKEISLEQFPVYLEEIEREYNMDKLGAKPYVSSSEYFKEEYIRPAKLFWEIENRLGEETWQEAIKTYYRKYAFKISTFKDFKIVIEQNTEKLVGDIFYKYGLTSSREEDER